MALDLSEPTLWLNAALVFKNWAQKRPELPTVDVFCTTFWYKPPVIGALPAWIHCWVFQVFIFKRNRGSGVPGTPSRQPGLGLLGSCRCLRGLSDPISTGISFLLTSPKSLGGFGARARLASEPSCLESYTARPIVLDFRVETARSLFMADTDAGVIGDLTVRTGPQRLRFLGHKCYAND